MSPPAAPKSAGANQLGLLISSCAEQSRANQRSRDIGTVRLAQAEMLDVVDGLVEELSDMAVIQPVDHGAATPFAIDQTERAQQAKLMGDSRLLHFDRSGELSHADR